MAQSTSGLDASAGGDLASVMAAVSAVSDGGGTQPAHLADLLGVSAAQAATVAAFGRFIARHAADLLGMALGQHVEIGAAAVRRLGPREAEGEDWDTYYPVDVRWETAGGTYSSLLLLPKAQLQAIVPAARATGDLWDMEALGSLLRELGSHLSAALEQAFQPEIQLSLADLGAAPHGEHEVLLRVEHPASVGGPGADSELTIIHLIPQEALESIAIAIHTAVAAEHELRAGTGSGAAYPTSEQEATPETMKSTAGFREAGGGVASTEDTMPTATQPAGTSVHPVQFEPIADDLEATSATNLDLLLDVSLRVSVELGRTERTIKDVLSLGPGSVLELDKLAGEPVDIFVNGRLIAKGEVVVVDENFGVRVTDIESPQKRLAKVR